MLAAGQRQALCQAGRSNVAGTPRAGVPAPHSRRAPCGSGVARGGEAGAGRGARHVARATLDEPELRTLVVKLREETPPPPEKRPILEACIAKIDEINSGDPKTVPGDSGRPEPFRLAYSKWLTKWVLKLDPQACDELLILTRGKNIESWKLAEIRRDDYAPNGGGQKAWEFDRKRWLAGRLGDVMKEAGYSGQELALVEDVMMARDVPNPRDMRLHDLVGPFGLVNNRLLLAACVMQTLADAEALLFLERNFEEAFDRMPANEVEALARRELGGLSQEAVVAAMKMKKWTPVQEKLLARALPKPFRFTDILRNAEGVAASSTHPGDHRYLNFDYE